jgi:hypothetical protein
MKKTIMKKPITPKPITPKQWLPLVVLLTLVTACGHKTELKLPPSEKPAPSDGLL